MKRRESGMGAARWLMMAAVVILAAAPTEGKGAAVPPEKECQRLAQESLLEFNKAILAKDFTSFYKYTAELWQKQTTAQELKETFQPFIDNNIDITPIEKMKPVFDLPPGLDSDEWLILTGHYRTTPSRVAFELKYIMEKDAWKLIGINLQVYPPNRMVPFDSILKKMAQDTMVEFSKAIKNKDFTAFYNTISDFWKEQTTPEELKKAFQSFIDLKLDLSDVAKVDPVLNDDANIDDNGALHFSGAFALKKGKLKFSLDYILEKDQWKLIGINVTMK